MRRLILTLALVMSFMGIKAQMEAMMQPLPLNPAVKHGVLPNGLTYYILHNEEPKNRANFYIAQKVGSSLETPDQLGLAHFLEHMAFNGTEHYPGHSMLDYLQSKGLRFGADINASTGFDETKYHINNVNTTDQALMDSVLLVLYDWSGSILLEDAEIDAERGVIQGEYTQRNDAGFRRNIAILPALYEEYQYQQSPIGKMEIIKNFDPQVLRDYYKKWYRPDLQGIIIVGDFDADVMEQKVIDLFSKIPMPANAAQRVYPTISDNKKPIYVTYNDPEWPQTSIAVMFKCERTPFEQRNTMYSFVMDELVADMVAEMINTRLGDYAQKPECPYTEAGVDIGTYAVSEQKGAFNVYITPKEGMIEEAFKAAMGIVAQACKTGFMGTEVQRTRDELLAGMQRRANEKNKTNNAVLGNELVNAFTEGTPAMDRDMEYQLASQMLMAFPEAIYNELCKELIHPDNYVVMICQPTTPNLNVPAEDAMLASMDQIINADYEMYVDEVITEPLIAQLPAPGKIVKETSDDNFGTKTFMLSNGVKVVVKPTDFTNDQIQIGAFSKRGQITYPMVEAANVDGLSSIFEISKMGPFTPSRLTKYLAGKTTSINYDVDAASTVISGVSTKKDLNTLFELFYSAFTDVSADQESFDAFKSRSIMALSNQEKNPMYIFQEKMVDTMYPGNEMVRMPTTKTFEDMNYDQILNLYKNSVANAADFTFIIVGNVDEASLKPLLEQYIASLPSTGSANKYEILVPVNIADGKIVNVFDIKAESPAVYVFNDVHQNGLPFNRENLVKIKLLGNVLDNVFTATLREEMGATYGTSVWTEFLPHFPYWAINWLSVSNPDQQEALRERGVKEFNNVMTNGAPEDYFKRVKEAALTQYENNVRTNGYWLSGLWYNELGYDIISTHRAAIENLTLENFNNFVKTLYNGENMIEVVGIAK